MMQAPYQPATNYWRAVEIEEIIRYGFPTGRGLDLGCGDGHLMGIIFAATGPRNLVGLDIDAAETAMAGARKIYRDVVTVPGNQIPFPDRDFDYVFSNSVLEHIENIDDVLREVARILRPNGRFLFTVPGPDFHAALRGPIAGDRDAYLREVDARCAHLRYWDVARWKQSLETAGLMLTHNHEYLTQTQVRRWETIARFTSGLLRTLSRGQKRPIEIQRGLGVRSTGVRLPKMVAAGSSALLQIGAGSAASPYGCLLIEAKRPG
jgi:SAM-dependent methyltransferase